MTTRQAYMVFSGRAALKVSSSKPTTATAGGDLAFTIAQSASQGLAIGLERDGYLLTAGHVVGKTNFVLGYFDGHFDVRPARVVFRNDLKYPADVALFKVEGKLADCAKFGENPKVGDGVVEVVCYRGPRDIGGNIDFAGGTVLNVKPGPRGSAVVLIETDVPAWHGDSGGPLLSDSGRLVGVFTEFRYNPLGQSPKYRSTCFLPDEAFLQSIIAGDRASVVSANLHSGTNRSVSPH